jgi:2-dehydropantoate 2-reductase
VRRRPTRRGEAGGARLCYLAVIIGEIIMKIAVMGAGAVGCFYGGMMARAGHEVTLIGRPEHVEAIRRDGLLLDTLTFQEHVALAASTSPEGVRGAELVLFCVKSGDTESAGRQIAPFLVPGAMLLGLQNGVDNAERLQAVLQREVVPAVVYVAAGMAGPGHVKHHGRGELVIGPSAASLGVAAAFTAGGVPVQVSDNVAGALWAKLIINCAYNALSALSQQPYGKLVQALGVTDVMADVVRECRAVAQAAGIAVPEDIWQSVLGIAAAMATQFSSTAQDVARGRPSEIDHLNGYIVRKGEALGVPAPVNRALHTLVKLREQTFP